MFDAGLKLSSRQMEEKSPSRFCFCYIVYIYFAARVKNEMKTRRVQASSVKLFLLTMLNRFNMPIQPFDTKRHSYAYKPGARTPPLQCKS